jgi:hypothetical protein
MVPYFIQPNSSMEMEKPEHFTMTANGNLIKFMKMDLLSIGRRGFGGGGNLEERDKGHFFAL